MKVRLERVAENFKVDPKGSKKALKALAALEVGGFTLENAKRGESVLEKFGG